ncbi:MAG: carbon starvation protein A [Bacteroidales bacterium]|nr:carbon starvation protein A [Bacteroidales bacterium]
MISFIIALVVLILGYFTYGVFVSRLFGADPNRKTPCFTCQDGVDYIPMPTWKVYMIQFLNIAGVGPIFGAIMGAQFGTASYLWIVLGTIFAGATHDYLAAMISVRHKGASLSEIVGIYLGKTSRWVMSAFMVVLLILVAAVFTSSPASILSEMTRGMMLPDSTNLYAWVGLIFTYYIVATLCPVDKIIGKVYPFFAFCLIFMAVGIGCYILIRHPELPEWWEEESFVNHEWMTEGNLQHLFPMMFISIACGAISGFHATQSPLMARCIQNEKVGRPCFYGAMVTEGIVALVWAAAATHFFNRHGLFNELGKGYDGGTVATHISNVWLGPVGAVLALIGVAVAPISSGDTALRSARLIIADFLRLEQKNIKNRLVVAIPIFVITMVILIWSMTDKNGFGMLWRYFGWSNQLLSVFTLWAITIYLQKNKRGLWYLVTMLPAMFMTTVCTSFILMLQKGGFGLDYNLSIGIGIGLAILLGLIVDVKAVNERYRKSHS